MAEPRSVVPDWISTLNLQQQSVLLLAARGPDGAGKNHPCKLLVRVYRGTVFRAARYGRLLDDGPWCREGDTFMDRRPLRVIDESEPPPPGVTNWSTVVRSFVSVMEELPHHYCTHLMHGVEILGYKHPDLRERMLWHSLYLRMVDAMHLQPESEKQMDARLSDWGREEWDYDDAATQVRLATLEERRRCTEVVRQYACGECDCPSMMVEAITTPDEPAAVVAVRERTDSTPVASQQPERPATPEELRAADKRRNAERNMEFLATDDSGGLLD